MKDLDISLKNHILKKNYYLLSFGSGVLLSLLFFLPMIIFDKGYFLYYGDFNVQQIPFYQMVHDAVRNGEFFWNNKTDLGVNLIGSYTFYMITSPFFWLTLVFPSKAVPYLMGPLLILKFGCLSLTSYIYLKRYVKNPKLAIIGSTLYAFSGFAIYNIFFNHFHEAMIIFPLLLAAIDKYMYEKTKGVVFLAVFASSFINYYFFVGQVVFAILYWVFKIVWGDFKFNLKEFLLLLIECILGLFASFIALLPSILAVIQNPRVENTYSGWSLLLYENEQRYIHILECFFFPPDIPARPNFTPNSNAKWASLGAWLPLFGMTGTIAWLQLKRQHWLKKFLVALFIIATIPILNSAFQLFNSAYYARWFYMLTLMTSLSTIMALQSSKIDWPKAIKWSVLITVSIAFPIGFIKNNSSGLSDKTSRLGLMDYPDRFWIYVSISLICLLTLSIIIFTNKKNMIKHLGISLFTVIFVYSSYIIALGKTQSYDTHNFIIPHCLNGKEDFNIPEIQNCRVDVYNGMDNQAMFWQFPTIQAFHSVVPGSIMEYYPSVGVKRDVGSRPETKFYGIRGLTSCKWLFDYIDDKDSFAEDLKFSPQMPGWSYYDTQNNFDIWENEYFIPYGFSYDYFVSMEDFNKTPEQNRNLLMLKSIVLDDDQVKNYSDILENINTTEPILYTKNSYFNDCLARKNDSCSYFSYDKYGFSATFENKTNREKLVFFSIPYESGWKAHVNNNLAKIEKVNVGFMAVKVPANQVSNIRFDYITPGLKLGAIISLISIILFFIYLIFCRKSIKEVNKTPNNKYHFASDEDKYIAEIKKLTCNF